MGRVYQLALAGSFGILPNNPSDIPPQEPDAPIQLKKVEAEVVIELEFKFLFHKNPQNHAGCAPFGCRGSEVVPSLRVQELNFVAQVCRINSCQMRFA